MQPKSSAMLRVLMNQYHQGAPESFLNPLSKEIATSIISQQAVSQKSAQAILIPKETINNIHYSWLVVPVKGFSDRMQPMVLASLSKNAATHLSRLLKKQPSDVPLSIPAKQFFLKLLCEKLKISQVLPPSFLPRTSVAPLLELKKNELVEMIDFLGLYDLAEEIRYIVDKKNLKAIYNCLSLKKQHFLRMCLHQKEKLTSVRMGLEKWNGKCDALEKMLHRRGLIRLGYALSGQHPDMLWHIIHRLDIGRGNFVSKYYAKEEIPGVTPALCQQALNVINFFKKMSEA